jgi:hypothetical protein
MKCFLPDFSPGWALELMQRFGYSVRQDTDGKKSFTRPIFTEARYPRFHVSVQVDENSIQINIHLDQEDNQGRGNHQFVWAYHNPLVVEESRRLQSLANVFRDEIKTKGLLPPALYIVPAVASPKSYSRKIIIFFAKRKILCRLF